ncbi:MAG: FxLYD domain-containing protein [Candidatus Binatia bacterium]
MRSVIRPDESSAARSIGACLFGAALAIFVFAACGAKRETIVSSTHTVTVDQGKPSPPRMVDISIVDLHEEPAADPQMEKVVGTIINQGERPVSKISIRIDLLDDAGNLVNSVTTPPLAQTIAALGGRATFEASVPRNPAVTTYHAVAIAQ